MSIDRFRFHRISLRLWSFFNRVTNVFVIGQGTKAWVSLPKGKGLKLTIAEERDVRRKQRASEAQS